MLPPQAQLSILLCQTDHTESTHCHGLQVCRPVVQLILRLSLCHQSSSGHGPSRPCLQANDDGLGQIELIFDAVDPGSSKFTAQQTLEFEGRRFAGKQLSIAPWFDVSHSVRHSSDTYAQLSVSCGSSGSQLASFAKFLLASLKFGMATPCIPFCVFASCSSGST